MKKKHLFIALLFSVMQNSVLASAVSTYMTVDNSFDYFISTQDNVAGNLIGSGSNWTSTYKFNAVLTPGVTNYLHIKATDIGVISAFIGEYHVSANFQFANGTQDLLTDTTYWNVNQTGFGQPYSTPISWGVNGQSPWQTRPKIGATAQFIWDPSKCINCTVYFSTPIVPVAAVPEPETAVLVAAGLGLVSAFNRRRKNNSISPVRAIA